MRSHSWTDELRKSDWENKVAVEPTWLAKKNAHKTVHYLHVHVVSNCLIFGGAGVFSGCLLG
jgi:hypothetical protein